MQHHTTNTNQCNWLECNNFLIAKVPTQPKSISRKINQKHLKLTPIGELTQANWTIGHANTIFTSIVMSITIIITIFTKPSKDDRLWCLTLLHNERGSFRGGLGAQGGGATNIKTSIILLCNSLIWKLASIVCACRAVLAPFLHERQFWKSKSNVKLSSLQYGLIHSNLDLIQFQKPFLIKHDSKTRLSKHPLHIFCGRHEH